MSSLLIHDHSKYTPRMLDERARIKQQRDAAAAAAERELERERERERARYDEKLKLQHADASSRYPGWRAGDLDATAKTVHTVIIFILSASWPCRAAYVFFCCAVAYFFSSSHWNSVVP